MISIVRTFLNIILIVFSEFKIMKTYLPFLSVLYVTRMAKHTAIVIKSVIQRENFVNLQLYSGTFSVHCRKLSKYK